MQIYVCNIRNISLSNYDSEAVLDNYTFIPPPPFVLIPHILPSALQFLLLAPYRMPVGEQAKKKKLASKPQRKCIIILTFRLARDLSAAPRFLNFR